MKRFASISILILILSLKLSSCDRSQKTTRVAIQPLGAVSAAKLDSVMVSISSLYGSDVIKMPSIDLPKSAFINEKSPRYRADKLLKILKNLKPDSVDYILGLTESDISTTKRDKLGRVKQPESKYRDWGVFGLGYRPGTACVVSTFRLGNPHKEITLERLRKVCIHELGHNLGLKHCTEGETCVMRDAVESIRTVDDEDLALCEVCAQKIQ